MRTMYSSARYRDGLLVKGPDIHPTDSRYNYERSTMWIPGWELGE